MLMVVFLKIVVFLIEVISNLVGEKLLKKKGKRRVSRWILFLRMEYWM